MLFQYGDWAQSPMKNIFKKDLMGIGPNPNPHVNIINILLILIKKNN